MSKTQYLYVRDHNNFPVGTFAYKVKTKKDGRVKLLFAYSVFYMADEYSRAYARSLTKKRLKEPLELTIEKNEKSLPLEADRLLIRALREVATNPINHWSLSAKPVLGHRFVAACKLKANKLGVALSQQLMHPRAA